MLAAVPVIDMGPVEQWIPAVVAIAAWPMVIVLIVVLVLVFVPRDRQLAMLSGITELVRAARAPGPPPAAIPLGPGLAAPTASGNDQPVELPEAAPVAGPAPLMTEEASAA